MREQIPVTRRGADLVFTFSFETWADAISHGTSMPAARLAGALLDHPEVGRVLIANPYRSRPIRIGRRLLGQRDAQLSPVSEHQRLWTPLRFRRRDPVSVAGLIRAYERLDRLLHRAAARMGLERPAVITTSPWIAGFSPLNWAGPVTFYAWDDWAAYPVHQRWWPAYEVAYERVRRSGRAVCAVSQPILERIAPTGPSRLVPNGLAPEEWEPPWAPPAWLEALERPRFVYIGSLDSRIDTHAVLETARRFPEAALVLVGPLLDREAFHPLESQSNVHFAAPVSRREVAGLLHGSDVCLLPHRRTRLTEAMSPLKLYEYLAAGRPVVSSDLPPVRGVDPRIIVVPEGESFADGVERALRLGPASEAERHAFIAANTWARRQDMILEIALRPAEPSAARVSAERPDHPGGSADDE